MRTTKEQTARIAPALLFCAIMLLQPVPEACADISAQDKEVIEAAKKVAPIVEEITKKLWSLKTRILKSGGDDSFGPHSQDH